MREAVFDPNKREDESFRGVEGGEDFVLGDDHVSSVGMPTLHLDEAQVAGARVAAFDVLALLLGRNIPRQVSQRPFRGHDRVHGGFLDQSPRDWVFAEAASELAGSKA